MLKYETGPFKKPAGMLLAVPSKRLTRKSKFLRRVEKRVQENIAFEQKVAAANRAKDADAWIDSWYKDDSEHYPEDVQPSDYNDAPLAPPMPAPRAIRATRNGQRIVSLDFISGACD